MAGRGTAVPRFRISWQTKMTPSLAWPEKGSDCRGRQCPAAHGLTPFPFPFGFRLLLADSHPAFPSPGSAPLAPGLILQGRPCSGLPSCHLHSLRKGVSRAASEAKGARSLSEN